MSEAIRVTAIELGAQSMLDTVLTVNQRGHTARQVREASALIKTFGFELGLQMMTGLYGDTVQGAKQTAIEIAKCKTGYGAHLSYCNHEAYLFGTAV